MHPTSGSTGLPKIALRPAPAALEEAAHYAATMQVTARDTIVAIPPMSHAYGYGMCVMLPLLTGASIITTRAFSTALVKRAIQEFSPSIVPAVPAMLDMLAHSGVNLSSVRWLLTAGSLMPGPSAERFRQRTGVTACPLYGTTETGGISVATAADGRDVDGRVGPPMRGVEVRLRPCDAALDAGPGVGKLLVRSTSMMAGYLDDEGNVLSVPDDGWFETGDLAQLAEGTIHLRGRDSEVINVAGMKVVPCEIEEVIRELAGVREVKVYAQAHHSGGQIVKAAVALEPGTTEDDIYAHCQRQLVYYKRPQLVVRVDALPRTPAGKINAAQLP
jgi:acyl-CoA synthetase (AMP-forming)/AMP-acid ligase II